METEEQLQQEEKVKQKFEMSYRAQGVSHGLYGENSSSNINILHVLHICQYGHSKYPFTMTVYSVGLSGLCSNYSLL